MSVDKEITISIKVLEGMLKVSLGEMYLEGYKDGREAASGQSMTLKSYLEDIVPMEERIQKTISSIESN